MGGDALGTTFQKVVGDDSRCVAAGAGTAGTDGGGLTGIMTFMNLMVGGVEFGTRNMPELCINRFCQQ